jgi:hypothetical protein
MRMEWSGHQKILARWLRRIVQLFSGLGVQCIFFNGLYVKDSQRDPAPYPRRAHTHPSPTAAMCYSYCPRGRGWTREQGRKATRTSAGADLEPLAEKSNAKLRRGCRASAVASSHNPTSRMPPWPPPDQAHSHVVATPQTRM